MKKEDPDLLGFIIKVIIIVLVTLWWLWVVNAIKTPIERRPETYRASLALITQDTLIGIVNPVYLKPIVYGMLIDCLEHYESAGNPDALGLAGERGCLQFMPQTWDRYCGGDPWDCDAAKRCADEMIQDGLIHSWTTAYRCANMY